MSSNEWFLFLHDFVNAVVGMECGLNGGEYDDGAVSTSATIKFKLR